METNEQSADEKPVTTQGDGEKAAVTETEPKTPETKTFDAEYVSKLRAEAAKYRTEAKTLAEKAKHWDEHSESQKSELTKAQEAAAAAQKALEEAKAEAMRSKVAAAKGLPQSIADRLRGSTLEEMEADADSVLAEINSKYVVKAAPSKADTGAGVTGKTVDYESMTPKELVEAVRKARQG